MNFASRTRTIDVYSSPTTHYIVGAVGSGLFRVLFFERNINTPEKLSDILYADPDLYDRRKLAKLLRSSSSKTTTERRIRMKESEDVEGNEVSGSDPLRSQVPVHQFRACALLGSIRFLKQYYLLFVFNKKRIGYVNGHVIYSIESTKLFPIALNSANTSNLKEDSGTDLNRSWTWLRSNRNPIDELEERYLSLFQLVDLTKGDFFFSYTLDLTNSLQMNFCKELVEDSFAWNDYLTTEIRETLLFDEQASEDIDPAIAKKLLWTTDSWLIPLVHGSFQQHRFSLFGKSLTLSLVGRRSRHNAGTRYLKRGVNEQGKVANHVEVEQILEVDGTSISSFVQVRGSIPTFWTQETSAAIPKPPIKRYRYDPTFLSTRLHFTDLLNRYHTPIFVLNLVRQAETRPRESQIGEEFAEACQMINVGLSTNHDLPIRYEGIDFKKMSKSGNSALLDSFANHAVHVNSVFYLDNSNNFNLQHGSVRTNCIDGLDRTNIGQFCVGLSSLHLQLRKAKVCLSDDRYAVNGPFLDFFVEMFENLGDRIAQQYGGSQAHKKGGVAPTSELLTSIRRYYSNSFTDRAKQDSINLFLGCFIPRNFHQLYRGSIVQEDNLSSKALWELDSDFYLHNFRVTDRATLALKIDAGTGRWWKENSNSTSRFKPTNLLVRSPLSDEEDSGAYVQFDKVFADEFFKPIPVGAVQHSEAIKKMFTSRHETSVTTTLLSMESDDEDEESIISNQIEEHVANMGGLGNTTILDVRSSLFNSPVDGERESDLLDVDLNTTTDLDIFKQRELLANSSTVAFEEIEHVDSAFLEYLEDFITDENDIRGTKRILMNFTTVPDSEFQDFPRTVKISDLYSNQFDTPSIYEFQNNETTTLKRKQEQIEIFQEHVSAHGLSYT